MPSKKETLELLEGQIKKCRACRLCETAKQAVPGEGNIDADIVFVGEAPGEQEDLTGRPFVGRAGKHLEGLLGQIGLKREDVWIGNIIKHRPPENRDPLPDEIAACEGFLAQQLRAIKPKLIVTLGRYSMFHFYKDGKISRDRGRAIFIGDYIVYPVYHPAAALRNPDMAKGLKEDFLRIPQVLEDIRLGKLKKPAQTSPNQVELSKPVEVPQGQIGLGF
jgi:DNA polymerase